ncbi:RICIN domain-containing protein [Streptomyces sp. NPDC008159]|uniref:RICIN domain-containing protein n=1 Tax=Streptomyces sp. NPDC008159 TaxID=3364817 RepID=UPI0036EF33D8
MDAVHTGACRAAAKSGRGTVLGSPAGSAQGAPLEQATDDDGDNQWWRLVPSPTSGYYRLVNVRNG